MRCSICNAKETVVSITHTEDGKSLAVHLCQRCAAEKGVLDSGDISLEALVGAVGASKLRERKGQESKSALYGEQAG
jgi:protein-arginine kinase activator protein McsA